MFTSVRFTKILTALPAAASLAACNDLAVEETTGNRRQT